MDPQQSHDEARDDDDERRQAVADRKEAAKDAKLDEQGA